MKEAATQLPAGYLDLGSVAIHVADVRKQTDDIERFKKYLPLVLELNDVEPHSEQAYAIYARVDNMFLFAKTLDEVGMLFLDGAIALAAEMAERVEEVVAISDPH